MNEPPPPRGYRDNGREDANARYEVQHDRQPPPPRGRVYDDVPPRRSRPADPLSPPRARSSVSSEDVHVFDRPLSIDGRPSDAGRIPQYDAPPDTRRAPRVRDDRATQYNDGGAPARQDWNSSRGPRDGHDDWKRPAEDAAERRFPVHPDRARIVDPPLPPPREPPYDRRANAGYRPRERAVEDASYPRQDASEKPGGSQRPAGLQRGPSLLARLNLDENLTELLPAQHAPRGGGDAPATVKRTLPEAAGLPPRPSEETTYAAEMDLDGGRGRVRKRKPQKKRGPEDP